jgi:hypothetical protein
VGCRWALTRDLRLPTVGHTLRGYAPSMAEVDERDDLDLVPVTRSEGSRRNSRAALIDAAFEEFSTKGYEATTVAGIADRAGVTTGARIVDALEPPLAAGRMVATRSRGCSAMACAWRRAKGTSSSWARRGWRCRCAGPAR